MYRSDGEVMGAVTGEVVEGRRPVDRLESTAGGADDVAAV